MYLREEHVHRLTRDAGERDDIASVPAEAGRFVLGASSWLSCGYVERSAGYR